MSSKPAPVKDRSDIFYKSSGFIGVINNVSLNSRRMWNHLAWHYRRTGEDAETHRIAMTELLKRMQLSTKNYEYIIERLRELTTSKAEWNAVGKDQAMRHIVTTWMAGGEVSIAANGTAEVVYGFSPWMRKQLADPSMFAKLDLATQERFSSKHSQAVWEMICDYQGIKATPWFEVGFIQKILDVNYSEYKYLKRDCLRKAEKEITKLSRYVICLDERKEGRKVTHVRYTIALKDITESPADLMDRDGQVEIWKRSDVEKEDLFDEVYRSMSERDQADLRKAAEDYLGGEERNHHTPMAIRMTMKQVWKQRLMESYTN